MEIAVVRKKKLSLPAAKRWRQLWRLLNWNNFKQFLIALKEIRYTGISGLVKKIRNRIQAEASQPETVSLALALPHFMPKPVIPRLPANLAPIDILIPIYNGYDYLATLLPSVLNNTTQPYRLVLFDDASPDLKVVEYLRQFQRENPTTVLIRAETNLGFVGAVNTAVKHVRNHFVLLNQDTEVPPHWLQRLMKPILDNPNIASTTPFTNAGTICSFPEFLKDNLLFDGLTVTQIDHYFQQIDAAHQLYPIPTGVGFCMGVNKTVVDKIGMFDAETFGRGYGEENDWCMRAQKAGYLNIQVPNLFVYHKHGSIFTTEEKQRLLQQNLQKLFAKHPEYPLLVDEYIRRDPLKAIRQFAAMLIATGQDPAGAVLFIDHDLGGGANLYRNQVLERLVEQENRKVLFLRYHFANKYYQLGYRSRQCEYEYRFEDFDTLEHLFKLLPAREIHVSNLVSFPRPADMAAALARLQAQHGFRLDVYVHDYFMVCPSYTLLNDHSRYCGIPANLAECKRCLARHSGEFWMFVERSAQDIEAWRKQWEKLLRAADAIVCFSQDSRRLIRKAYPALGEDKFRLQPHQVTDLPRLPAQPPTHTFHIGVLGSINLQKGLGILREMAELIANSRYSIKIIVIGRTSAPLPASVVEITGGYEREDLPVLIQKHQIDLFFIPSIWPETFSYTSEEIMQMGLPLAVFNLGAPAERVKDYPQGLIIDRLDAAHALSKMLEWRAARS